MAVMEFRLLQRVRLARPTPEAVGVAVEKEIFQAQTAQQAAPA